MNKMWRGFSEQLFTSKGDLNYGKGKSIFR